MMNSKASGRPECDLSAKRHVCREGNRDRLFRIMLVGERRRESRDDLDQIRLAADAGLLEQTAEMLLHGGFGNTERHRNLGNPADFDRWRAARAIRWASGCRTGR